MEVTVEETGKLKRRLTVEVPLSEVSAAYDAVYSQIRANIRVNGFRPGKYPRRLAEKRFKSLMAQEALRTLVPKYFDQAIKEKELQPATEPEFDNLDIDKNRPFRFNVEFEVMPEFELPEPSDFTLEPKEPTVEPGEIDERIEEMRGSRASQEDKGDEPAGSGDVATFDFSGDLDGEPFPGGNGTDQQLEVGAGRYLERFEEELAGMRAGEEKDFDLPFPADYRDENLAGKTAHFHVTVKKVERKVLPELDKDFFSQFGELETLEAFREHVAGEIRQERQRDIEQQYQDEVARQIRERYDFDVPEGLVERALAEYEHRLSHDDPEAARDPERLEALKAEERKRQEDSLRLNYVLEKVAQADDISVSPEELRTRFMLQAYMMQQDPEQLMQSQYGNLILHQLQQQMLTQRTLGHLVDRILGREPAAQAQEAGEAAVGEAQEAGEGEPAREAAVGEAQEAGEGEPAREAAVGEAQEPARAEPAAGPGAGPATPPESPEEAAPGEEPRE